MLEVEFLPHFFYAFVEDIDPVFGRQGRELFENVEPFARLFLAEPLLPFERGRKPVAPVGKLESRVFCLEGVCVFRHGRKRRGKLEDAAVFPRVRRQKFRRFENGVAPFFERLRRRVRPVNFLGKVNRVRLLPNQRRVD